MPRVLTDLVDLLVHVGTVSTMTDIQQPQTTGRWGRFGEHDGGGDGWWITDEVLDYIHQETSHRPSVKTWQTWIEEGRAPRPHRYFGSHPMWMTSAIREWQHDRNHGTSLWCSQPPPPINARKHNPQAA